MNEVTELVREASTPRESKSQRLTLKGLPTSTGPYAFVA